MVTHAAKGNGNISWLCCHLTEKKNGEIFEGFTAFWSSSDIGFTRARIIPAAASDKPILETRQGHKQNRCVTVCAGEIHIAGLTLVPMGFSGGLQQSFDFSDASIAAFQGNKLPCHTQAHSLMPEGTIVNL